MFTLIHTYGLAANCTNKLLHPELDLFADPFSYLRHTVIKLDIPMNVVDGKMLVANSKLVSFCNNTTAIYHLANKI